MPFPGLDEEQTAWMDKCVMKVMPTIKGSAPHEAKKSHAVAICRATLNKMKGDTAKAQIILDRDFIVEFHDIVLGEKINE